ncbi:MAG: hypothetical protein KAG26_02695 [Methylococcales bacterium]|nr:hypothetical protein [Methylococcales bacterium]
MNPISEKTEDTAANLQTLVTVICHLMTCYAMHPCEEIAANINRHMHFLLAPSMAIELGDWKSTFIQLQTQWDVITQRHQHQKNSRTLLATH